MTGQSLPRGWRVWRQTGTQVRELLPSVPVAPEQPWTRGQAALRVMAITVEQHGLKPGQYREDAEFVKDLGVD